MFNLYKFLDWLYEANKTTPHTSHHHKESFYAHTIAVAYNAVCTLPSRRLYIAALLHDIGKPETLAIHEEKGSTFYNHESHINMVKEFLSEDDEDYYDVCNLIQYHMIPYTMKGPDPWKSVAEQTFMNNIRTHDTSFMRDLLTLHMCDMKGSYSDETKVPIEDDLLKMIQKIRYPKLYTESE